MKKIFLFICFFPLFVFASFTRTIVIQAHGNNDVHSDGSIEAVPCTVTVSVSGGRAGVGNRHDTSSSAQWSYYDDAAVGLQFWAKGSSNNPADTDLTATFVIEYPNYNPTPDSHETQYGHPLNACPMGCGVCLTCTAGHGVWNSQLERIVYACESGGGGGGGGGGDGGSSDAPWARENTLQAVGSVLQAIGRSDSNIDQNLSQLGRDFGSFRTVFDIFTGKFNDFNNSVLDGFLNSLSKQDTTNQHLSDLKSKSDTSNGHLNDLNGKADTANGHLNDIKSAAATTNSQLTDLRDKAATNNQNVSDTRQFTEQIKNSLQPQNVTPPTLENPLDDITPNTSTITTLKNKLLPRYSFFTNSGGSQFPEWSFTLPLQSLGWRDFTFTFGGAAWSTVGGGVLLTLMQFVRTLSKFVFYFIFLRCIILYLRQW